MPAVRRQRFKAIATIDLTPLMDLTFMLLIVFVITVPVIEYVTDVTPPEMNSNQTAEEIEEPVVIVLNEAGVISLNEQSVSLQELPALLQEMQRQRSALTVLVRADGTRPYEEVVAVMRVAHNAGVTSISLMTQAERSK
ncbi:MAG: biopolymer transporter ExbD [Oligosphaeraceae bacterium]|mgnify:CR=1 FL=1|nr:biopolymer transporter ExbD [Oligosphaeraceae bacterium]